MKNIGKKRYFNTPSNPQQQDERPEYGMGQFMYEFIGTLGCLSFLIAVVVMSLRYGPETPRAVMHVMSMAVPFAIPATTFGMVLLYLKNKRALAINMCTNIVLIYVGLLLSIA